MSATKPTTDRRSGGPAAAVAPGRLEIVQDFVNTLDVRAERDELRTPETTTLWLVRRGLMPSIAMLDEADWRSALEVRHGLRALLRSQSGQPLDEAALERLNEELGDTHLRLRCAADGEMWFDSPEPGWKGALAKLVDIVLTATGTGRWERLKACADMACQRAFYDASGDAKRCDLHRGGRTEDRTSPCRGTRSARVRRVPPRE